MLLGGADVRRRRATNAVLYPLVLGGVVDHRVDHRHVLRQGEATGGKIMNALYKGVIVSGVLAAIAFWFITKQMMAGNATARCTCSAARWSAWR